MKIINLFKQKQNKNMESTYVCSTCGEAHEEWPAIAFDFPDSYYFLSEEFKISKGYIDTDFCIVEHEDQTDRFICVTMTQKVVDCDQDLEYGLWVSLSEKSFEDYKRNFGEKNEIVTYFGWLNNELYEYEVGQPIPMNVITKSDGKRPEVIPHESCDHEMVKDYYGGITKEEALRRIAKILK